MVDLGNGIGASALLNLNGHDPVSNRRGPYKRKTKRKKYKMSAAARAAISKRMKAMWREKNK